MMAYIAIAVGVVMLGLGGYGAYEKHRADKQEARAEHAEKIARLWKEASERAQLQRDEARGDFNKSLQAVEDTFQKQREGLEHDRDQALARVRSTGPTGGLRIRTTGPCAPAATKSSSVAAAPQRDTRAAGTDIPTESLGQVRLADADAEFLIDQANRADRIVLQLTAAQMLLQACYQTVEAP